MRDGNTDKGHRLPWSCYPFLLIGSDLRQVGIGLIGLMIQFFVYHDIPGSGFFLNPDTGRRIETVAILPVSILGIGFLLLGLIDSRVKMGILKSAKVVGAELSHVREVRPFESTEYELTFKFTDGDEKWTTFQVKRDQDDIGIGKVINVAVSRDSRVALLEADLPGGITFANIYSHAAISAICWARILVIPFLTLLPLAALIGPVLGFIQHVTWLIGLPILCWSTAVMQLIWYYTQRRYFCPGNPVYLDTKCECRQDR